MKFTDLVFDDCYDGVQAKPTFQNGYGASVIRHSSSRGSDRGLYEIAVLHNDRLTYDTPVTDDVLGYLTEADVDRVLGEIEALPPRAEQLTHASEE